MLHGLCEDVPPPTSTIWWGALHPWAEAPSASGHGWSIGNDNSITINWITQLPAPQQLLELVSCSCKRDCVATKCSCCSSGKQCTDVCQCVHCVNRSQEGKFKTWLMRAATMVMQVRMNPLEILLDNVNKTFDLL